MYVAREQRSLSALGAALVVGAALIGLTLGLAGPAPKTKSPPALAATFSAAKPPRPKPKAPPTPRPLPRPQPAKSPAAKAPRDAPAIKPDAAPAPAAAAPLVIIPPSLVAVPVASGHGAAGAGQGSGRNVGGTGSGGGGGAGTGGGEANSGVAVRPRQIAGRLHWSDLPPDLRKTRSGGDLTLRYRIGTDGRVSGCTILSSSGRPDFDSATCAHITARFRFRPARDAAGQPVPYIMTEVHGWDAEAPQP